ncbi:MAG: TolC family outer membrane protein [Paracoccaceae bacterium]
MVRKAIGVGIISILVTLASGASARAETLTDALISSYKNSGLLDQNRALLRAADEDVAQAVANLRPVLNYVLSSSYSSLADRAPLSDGVSANLELSANFLLYDFGRSRLGIDVAKENVLALREALVGIEQNVLLRAVSAYVGVQRDISIVDLRNSNVRLITQELRAARDRFEVGEITRTDVSLAEARLAAAQSGLAVAIGNLDISREEYRAAVGRYPDNLAPLPTTPVTASSQDAALSVARQRHPDILQAQRNVTVADLSIALANAVMRPNISGSASVGVDRDGQDSHRLGVTLSGPIYAGGALAAAERAAAARRDASLAVLHLTRIAVDQNVGNAWARLKVASAAIQASDQQIRAATVAFQGVREEAALGARTTLDVLNAEQELLDARASRISATSDRYIAIYNLLAAMGLLTVDHLKLGIVTYDASAYYNAVKAAPSYRVSPQGDKLDRVLKSIGKN